MAGYPIDSLTPVLRPWSLSDQWYWHNLVILLVSTVEKGEDYEPILNGAAHACGVS